MEPVVGSQIVLVAWKAAYSFGLGRLAI